MNNIIFNLVVTEKCNLACKYCYMHNNDNYMSANIIDSLYNNSQKLLDLFDGKTFNIDFFGGEPLLNWDIIRYTIDKFKDVDKKTFYCIISNLLLLTDDKVDYMLNNDIGASWSFDGLWNQDTRVDVNNNSTFDTYIEKLDLIRRVATSCKCTITPYQMYSDITLVENFRFMQDELGITPDYSISKDNGWTDETVDKFLYQLEEFVDMYIDYCNSGLLITCGFFNLYLADTILYKKTGKRNFSCFAGQNGISIMPNGDIYPCARYGTSCLSKMGNILDTNTIHPFEYQEQLNPVNFDECKKCNMYGWCNSGCQFAQQCNGFKPIKTYCKLYKGIYKKALYVCEKLNNNKEWLRSLHYETNIMNGLKCS